jgi:hypothetical protein
MQCRFRRQSNPKDFDHKEINMESSMSSTDPQSSTKPPSLPERAGRLALLGPPPLFDGEDTAAYDELLARISGG